MSNPQRPHGPQPTRLPPSVGFSRQEYWSGVPLLALLKMTHLSTYQKGFVVPEQVTLQAPQSIASYGMGHNPGFNVPQPVKHFKENRGFEKPESLRFGFSFAQQIHIKCLLWAGTTLDTEMQQRTKQTQAPPSRWVCSGGLTCPPPPTPPTMQRVLVCIPGPQMCSVL